MTVKAYKTPIVRVGDDLFSILEKNLPPLKERDVVVVTSKIVALCESAVVNVDPSWTKEDKHNIVAKEAEYYIDPHSSKYNLMLTIKHRILAVNAGIDESNADGVYVLWPKDPQRSANQIWQFLRQKYGLKEVGVILSDSKTTPLRWGVTVTSLTHCGFAAINDMRGKPDLFGRPMKMTTINVADSLAAAAGYEMGETNESTPIAVIQEASWVQFQDREPTPEELKNLEIELEDDAYAPILQTADWKRGGGKFAVGTICLTEH